MAPDKRSALVRYFDADAVARIAAVGFQPLTRVEGSLVGKHRSPFHGFAIEFAGHRHDSEGAHDRGHGDRQPLGGDQVAVDHDADAGRDEKQRHVRQQQLRGLLEPLDLDQADPEGDQQQAHAEDVAWKRQAEQAAEDFPAELEQQQ